MESLSSAALALTLLAGVLLALGIRDIVRRQPFPAAEHGSLRISGRGMKWVWSLGLLGAFAAGGPEIMSRSMTEGSLVTVAAPAGGAARTPVGRTSTSWQVHVASYAASGSETRDSGEGYQRTRRNGVRAPTWLPFVLLMYWLVVVRPALRSRRTMTDRRTTTV